MSQNKPFRTLRGGKTLKIASFGHIEYYGLFNQLDKTLFSIYICDRIMLVHIERSCQLWEHKNTESTSENSVANISWDSLISENNKRLRFSVAYDEDKAYAIILDSSGAGQSFYRVFITVDGGKTCAENSSFKLLNFCDYNMITLKNGDILAFQNWPDDTSIDTNICIYGVDKQTDNFFEKRINNWFDDFNIDEDITFITEAEYSDNYFFYIKIKEKLNEKNVLFSGTVEIDSETYLPKNIIRDEEE